MLKMQIPSFDITSIFECGQCFRWKRQQDGSYLGIVGNSVWEVSQNKQEITFDSNTNENLLEHVKQYFDLQRDYEAIQKTLVNSDKTLSESISYGKGIRLLNQDLWETLISFIISANNNIPRIKKIIETLAQNYGNPIQWKKNTYYTFPTAEQLAKVTVPEYRQMGLGFRDKYIYEVVRRVLQKELILEELETIEDTQVLRQKLMELPGVGEKVADCVLLFSTLKRLEVFPIDVWVRRVMKELYFPEIEESKLDKKQIQEMAHKKYKNLAGMAQQYLFYWKREA